MVAEATENQAMASIMTIDDANPLSENGESNRFLYSEGPVYGTPSGKTSALRLQGSQRGSLGPGAGE